MSEKYYNIINGSKKAPNSIIFENKIYDKEDISLHTIIPIDLKRHFDYTSNIDDFIKYISNNSVDSNNENKILILKNNDKTIDRLIILGSNILKINLLQLNRYY